MYACNSRGSFYGPVKDIPLDVYTIDSDTADIYVDESIVNDIIDTIKDGYTCIRINTIGINGNFMVIGDTDAEIHAEKNINYTEEATFFMFGYYIYIITMTKSISDDLKTVTRFPVFVLYKDFVEGQSKNIKSLLGRQIKYITDNTDLSNAKKGTITFHYASVEI